MNLQMDGGIAGQYTSNSQRMRVITENWVGQNLFCPYCGNAHLIHFENNRPVADFYCPNCSEEYELKSKCGPIGNKINDGAYETMIDRICSDDNPDFLFLNYEKENLQVKDLIMVPKYFFTPQIIEKRKPLAQTARRAGWVGCNIILKDIPQEGRIYIVKNGAAQETRNVINEVNKTNFISQFALDARGWIVDILNCVNKIESNSFTLAEMYQFEEILSLKHPENHHIKDKIRQQLQVLRDKGIIEFAGRGKYKKVKQPLFQSP